MKQLLLIRHAKALNETSSGDFLRELKYSGKSDAAELAKQLKKHGFIPDIIYSSPAPRALTTADIITQSLGLAAPNPISLVYEASEKTLLNIINNFPEEYNFVALTGHNPGLSMISIYLTANYFELSTAAAILISFSCELWAEVSGGTGTKVWFSGE